MKWVISVVLLFAAGVATAAEINKVGWTIQASSQETATLQAEAQRAIDYDVNTFWHSAMSAKHPHEIKIDMGQSWKVNGFSYLALRQDSPNGRIKDFEFYVSELTTDWGAAVAAGTFANDSLEKKITFTAKQGRHVRFKMLSEVNGNPWAGIAEFGVFGDPIGATATITTKLKFEWTQPGPVDNLSGWGVWQKEMIAGDWTKILDVAYTGQAQPVEEISFNVSGMAGSTIRNWFAVDAVSKTGLRTERCEEVFFDFVLPAAEPTIEKPTNLQVIEVLK